MVDATSRVSKAVAELERQVLGAERNERTDPAQAAKEARAAVSTALDIASVYAGKSRTAFERSGGHIDPEDQKVLAKEMGWYKKEIDRIRKGPTIEELKKMERGEEPRL